MKGKRAIVLSIVFVMIFTEVCYGADYNYGFEGFKYYVTTDKEATVVGYSRIAKEDYEIPSVIMGDVDVTRIGRYAFNNWDEPTGIKIPNSVTVIEDGAFYDCRGITSIDIPDSVISVEPYGFYGCWKATTLNISENMTRIRDYTFYKCFNLTDINIPDSITDIGEGAFMTCNHMTGITIPDSVTRIGGNAFEGCDDLISFTFPKDIKIIGSRVLKGCNDLEDVYIPNGVTNIGQYAFYGCTRLEDIIIPDTVTGIEGFAFSSCIDLTNMSIPSGVKYIRTGAFDNCDSLKKITLLSRDIELNNIITQGSDNVVIHGYKGSTAETYANENNIAFTVLIEAYKPNISVVIPVNANDLTPVGTDLTPVGGLGEITTTDGEITTNAPTIAYQLSDINSAVIGEVLNIDLSLAFANEGNRLSFSTNKGEIERLNLKYTPITSDIIDGKINVIVKVTDTYGRTATNAFDIYIAQDMDALNNAPIVVKPIADIDQAEVNVKITIDLEDIFSDPDGDILTYVVSTGGDFEAYESTYVVIPTPDMIGQINTVRIRAIDTEHGLWVEDSFNYTVVELVIDVQTVIETLFDDTKTHWGKIAIEELAKKGVINGKSQTTFAPNDTITRAEFVTLMVRYFELTSNSTENYVDVESDKWYRKNIAIAKEKDILPLIYGEYFEPDKEISREDMMYILHKSILLSGKNISEENSSINDFTDTGSISGYALEGAKYLVSRDIIHGYDNKINPTNTSTRAEVAQMLYNLLSR